MSSTGHSRVLARLARFRRELKWAQVQRAWGFWLGLLPLHVLVLAILEHTGDHSLDTRQNLLHFLELGFWLWAAGLLVPALWIFGVRRGTPSDEELAGQLGWGSAEIRDRLLNALQLQNGSRENREGYDPELMLASLDQLLPALDRHEDRRSLPLASRTRALKSGAGMALVLVLIALAGGHDSLTALQRILHPERDFRPPAAFSLLLSSDRDTLILGERLSIEVEPRGTELPAQVELFSQVGHEEPVRRVLPLKRGVARAEDLGPAVSTRFWAAAGEIHSDTLDVLVRIPPVLRELRVAFQPPAYTGLPRQELPEGLGDVHCPVGSRVELSGRLSEPVSLATLSLEAGRGPEQKSLLDNFGDAGDSLAFRTQFVARGAGRWELAFLDHEGLPTRGDLAHELSVIPDQPPVLRVLVPTESEGRLERDLSQKLVAVAEDDYGIGRLRLVYTIRSGLLSHGEELPDPSQLTAPPEGWHEKDLPLNRSERVRATLDDNWDLSPAGLLPDDRVHFYLEVFDNDGWNGAKSVRSVLYTLKVPGMEELYAEVEEDQGDLASEAAEILEETRENSRHLQELSQEMRKQPEPSWEQQQKLKQLTERQEELMQQASETSEKLEQLQQKLEMNNMVSEELKQKFMRLSELLKEAIDPELMEKLKQASQQVQAEETPQAPREKNLQEMKDLLKEMERQMEQFLSVLEDMRMQQKLEEFGRRLMEMADRQDQLGQDMDQRSGQELAPEEQALRKDFQELQKEIGQFQQDFSDKSTMPREQLQSYQEQVQQAQPESAMQELSEQLQAGDTGEQSQQDSDKLELDLESLAAQMQDAAKQASNNSKNEMAREIDRVCQELLVLSHLQEKVNAGNTDLDARSARLPVLAEQALENRLGVAACADAVGAMSMKSFLIPKRALALLGAGLSSLDRMLVSYEERNLGELRRNGPHVLGNVNQTILALKEAKSQMQQASSSSGFEEMMEQLAQASARQQGLNGQCSKLMSNTPGNSQKPMSVSFGDAAAQQGELRQQMESLAAKLGQEGRSKGSGKTPGQGEAGEEGEPQPGSGKRPGDQPGEQQVLGDMGQVASDMKEVEKDLANQQYTERTRMLQERILTRLLEAQQSVRRQDFSQKRQSRSADPLKAAAPPELSGVQNTESLEQDLLRALREGYTPEYEKLIRDYFRALESDGTRAEDRVDEAE
ncbi:MAG: hypothetical protein H6678_08480 [Candidatus Delongbacteria bacterium]|nr:hypothetical protein [Candidatus Delongbacteria bacterium]